MRFRGETLFHGEGAIGVCRSSAPSNNLRDDKVKFMKLKRLRRLRDKDIVEFVRSSAELAAVLEVSGWPKPGNVHRTRDHPDARYEHFLAGSIALGPSISIAARRGLMLAKGKIEASRVGLGRLIKKAVLDIVKFHYGGNTHLGASLLFIPLAVAASKTLFDNGEIRPEDLRNNVGQVIKATTARDAVKVYEAIASASSPRELGRLERGGIPDVYDEKAKEKLLERGITLYRVMEESSHYDTIAKELSTSMETSFNIGYKCIMEIFEETGDINTSTVHTFLKILSVVPDTFIARKVGLKKIRNIEEAVRLGIKETFWISDTAREILKLGGLTTDEGRRALWMFDKKLQGFGKDYNPGTTADLTAASLMIALLSGLKF
ncbi:ATP--dephospho-CoA triphosphoribosyl transferase CitG [Candidatus Bathyarchaeota archaeon]|nr:MAG: ATP--dephospho-CoA triphosphoribosyl transferase CitG [Candidatus Bathyarchaeota archaeon]